MTNTQWKWTHSLQGCFISMLSHASKFGSVMCLGEQQKMSETKMRLEQANQGWAALEIYVSHKINPLSLQLTWVGCRCCLYPLPLMHSWWNSLVEIIFVSSNRDNLACINLTLLVLQLHEITHILPRFDADLVVVSRKNLSKRYLILSNIVYILFYETIPFTFMFMVAYCANFFTLALCRIS